MAEISAALDTLELQFYDVADNVDGLEKIKYLVTLDCGRVTGENSTIEKVLLASPRCHTGQKFSFGPCHTLASRIKKLLSYRSRSVNNNAEIGPFLAAKKQGGT